MYCHRVLYHLVGRNVGLAVVARMRKSGEWQCIYVVHFAFRKRFVCWVYNKFRMFQLLGYASVCERVGFAFNDDEVFGVVAFVGKDFGVGVKFYIVLLFVVFVA